MGAKMNAIKPKNINAALKLIEQHELVGAKILVPAQRYEEIQRWKNDEERLIYTLKKYMNGYLCQDIK
jgi:hypothetical protein